MIAVDLLTRLLKHYSIAYIALIVRRFHIVE